jgi:hypothetical protein
VVRVEWAVLVRWGKVMMVEREEERVCVGKVTTPQVNIAWI